MYNKHIISEREAIDALAVIYGFHMADPINEALITKDSIVKMASAAYKELPAKLRNAFNAKLTNLKQGLEGKEGIGTPTDFLTDVGKLVADMDGDIQQVAKKLGQTAKQLKGEGTTQEAQSSLREGVNQKFEKFLRKWGMNIAIPATLALSFFGNLAYNAYGAVKSQFTGKAATNMVQVMTPGNITKDAAGLKQVNLGDYMKSLGSKPGGSGDKAPGGSDPGTSDADSDAVLKALNAQNTDFSDTDGPPNNDDDEVTKGVQFNTGGGYLSPEVQAKVVKSIVDDVLQKIEDQGGKVGTIEISPDAHITYDADDPGNSNKANGGGDLLKLRGATMKGIAKEVERQLSDILKEKVKIKVKELTKDNWKNQKQVKQDPQAKKAQAGTVTVKVNKGPKKIGILAPLRDFPSEPIPTGGSEEPRGGDEKPREKAGAEQPRTSDAVVGTDKILAQARGSNRLGQYGAIFKVLSNDKSDIFQALGKKPGETITDRELETLRNKKEGEASTLAQVILNSRKNPNTFLKKFAAAMGGKIDVEKRQRAYMAGAGEKGRSASGLNQGTVAELLREEFENMLTEAGVDQFLADASSLPKEVKLKVLALLADMYIQDNPEETISLVDPKEFGFTAQEITDAGFAFEPTSKKYIKLAKGEKKPTKGGTQQAAGFDKTQNSTITAPDVGRAEKALLNTSQLEQYFFTINTPDELAQLLIGLLQRFNKGKFTPQQVNTTLSNARSNLMEAQVQFSPDVKRLLDAIDKNNLLSSRLSDINDVKEASQMILRVALPFVNPKLTHGNIQTAIKQAQEHFAKDPKADTVGQPQQPQAGSSSQSKNTTATMPGNFKYSITKEEIQRFQKLAGIIK